MSSCVPYLLHLHIWPLFLIAVLLSSACLCLLFLYFIFLAMPPFMMLALSSTPLSVHCLSTGLVITKYSVCDKQTFNDVLAYQCGNVGQKNPCTTLVYQCVSRGMFSTMTLSCLHSPLLLFWHLRIS